MGNLRLSPRQLRFVEEYLSDGNGERAYSVAYDRPPSPAVRACASRLLTRANVAVALADHAQKAAEKAQITAEEVIAGLKAEATGEHPKADSTANSRTQAWVALGKVLALFTDKTDHTTGGRPLPPTALTVTLVKPEALNGDG